MVRPRPVTTTLRTGNVAPPQHLRRIYDRFTSARWRRRLSARKTKTCPARGSSARVFAKCNEPVVGKVREAHVHTTHMSHLASSLARSAGGRHRLGGVGQ